MRKVIIPKGAMPPDSWLEAAQKATSELRAATNEDERKVLIAKYERLWQDDRVRDWLRELYHRKCWYTEAKESVSAYHVDHYRPKGRVRDLDRNEYEGYWWLAFDWTNYRVCGQLINVKKRDLFPLTECQRACHDDPKSLEKEAAVLIDPITDDARLISYELDEDACIAVPAGGIDDDDEFRATATIKILGLNRVSQLRSNRADIWRECREEIANYSAYSGSPQCLKRLGQALAISSLRKMTAYEQEFSSVAEACLRKTAPESVQAKVYDRQ